MFSTKLFSLSNIPIDDEFVLPVLDVSTVTVAIPVISNSIQEDSAFPSSIAKVDALARFAFVPFIVKNPLPNFVSWIIGKPCWTFSNSIAASNIYVPGPKDWSVLSESVPLSSIIPVPTFAKKNDFAVMFPSL